MNTKTICLLACVVLVFAGVAKAETEVEKNPGSWLDQYWAYADDSNVSQTPPTDLQDAESDQYPPSSRAAQRNTIEGVGGGIFVPSAYLANPGPKDQIFGLPSVTGTFFGVFGRKNLFSLAVSETLFGRLEFSYAVSRFDTGNLNSVVRRTIANSLKDRGIWMHNFNLRGLLIEEDSFDLPVPAVTAGIHFKYNQTIKDINNRLLIPMDTIGYERDNGLELTLTATKRIHIDPLPPVEVTVGMRNSDAAQLGYMGFSSHRNTTIELGVTAYPTDWLAISYEFRRKENAFSGPPVAGLIRGEENWNGVNVSIIPCENLSVNLGVTWFGNIANQANAVGPTFSVNYKF